MAHLMEKAITFVLFLLSQPHLVLKFCDYYAGRWDAGFTWLSVCLQGHSSVLQ